jgi:hypothetical protein
MSFLEIAVGGLVLALCAVVALAFGYGAAGYQHWRRVRRWAAAEARARERGSHGGRLGSVPPGAALPATSRRSCRDCRLAPRAG